MARSVLLRGLAIVYLIAFASMLPQINGLVGSNGILPIALGLGAGAESRKPLGMAVVGGMVFSTALTLIVVPVVYALLARFAGEPARATVPVPGLPAEPALAPVPVPAGGAAPLPAGAPARASAPAGPPLG